jgi:ubiquinol-cytochrome c reductase cytochrome b subunit
VPLVLLGLVVAHIIALHEVGSNNPDGVEIKAPGAPKDAQGHPLDGIPFHPYYTVHDIFSVSIFLMVFTAIVFFAPEFGGYFLEYNNFIPADPLKTPLHIAPVWYFTPYYSMLRAITGEMMYVLIACVLLGAFLAVKNNAMPSPVKSIRYRPEWHKYVYAVFVIDFLILGYLGVQPPSPIGERVSQVGTMFYFGFFLLMPWWSKLGTPKPVPDRVVFVAH